eukprot:scpid30446/ scgid3405/ RING finger protein B
MACLIHYLADISQPPLVLENPCRQSPTSAQLSCWPDHLLLFVAGGSVPEEGISLSLVCGSTSHHVGTLSADNLVLHSSCGPSPDDVTDLRLTASVVSPDGVYATDTDGYGLHGVTGNVDNRNSPSSPCTVSHSAAADLNHLFVPCKDANSASVASSGSTSPSTAALSSRHASPAASPQRQAVDSLRCSAETSPSAAIVRRASGSSDTPSNCSPAGPSDGEGSNHHAADLPGLDKSHLSPSNHGDKSGDGGKSGDGDRSSDGSKSSDGGKSGDGDRSRDCVATSISNSPRISACDDAQSASPLGTLQPSNDGTGACTASPLGALQQSTDDTGTGIADTCMADMASRSTGSQDAGYGTERSPSIVLTPSVRAMPPSPPVSSTLSAQIALPAPAVETPGSSILPPVFDDYDSDDSELPWPKSSPLDLESLTGEAAATALPSCTDSNDLLPPGPSAAAVEEASSAPVSKNGSPDTSASVCTLLQPLSSTDKLDATPVRRTSLTVESAFNGADEPAPITPVEKSAHVDENGDQTQSTSSKTNSLLTTPIPDDWTESASTTPVTATSSGRGRKRSKGARRSNAKRPRKLGNDLSPSRAESDKPTVMTGRWGHAACLLDDSSVLVLGGEGTYKRMAKDSLLRVTVGESSNASYSEVVCEDTSCPERRTGHSAVLDPDNKMLYMYGGSKGKKWFSDVQALDLTTWQWQKLEMKGVAPQRAYHTCSFFRQEGLVFGGIFPEPDPEPDGSSNDLFIFSLSEQNWYKPVVTGDLPCPRSGHSAARLGHHLYILGGWDYPSFFNDLFVLDLELMDFKTASPAGLGPCARTWHTTVVLPDHRLLVYGGYSGDIALSDAFILDTASMQWSAVKSESPLLALPARVGHTMTSTPEAEDGTSKLLVCGGGDNDGKFFSDLVVLRSDGI